MHLWLQGVVQAEYVSLMHDLQDLSLPGDPSALQPAGYVSGKGDLSACGLLS